jgi:hypothetical protein
MGSVMNCVVFPQNSYAEALALSVTILEDRTFMAGIK